MRRELRVIGVPLLIAGLLIGSACTRVRPVDRISPAPNTTTAIVSSDVDLFWAAYDSLRTTTDSLAQLRILRARYLERGTPGLAALTAARDYTAEEWVGAVRRYPRYFASIRPRTVEIGRLISDSVAPPLARLRALYPELRPATVYVTVGALRTGGTTRDSLVLIGADLAAGGPETDIGEFTGGMRAFLARYFASQPRTTLVPLTVHEVVHTQQRGIGETVLARAIREGSADLITELATGRRMPLPYMTHGPAREAALRETFKAMMFTPRIGYWFYNQTSTDPAHVPDLGYYMGYVIARSYYERAPDKRAAIRDMVELPFDDDAAVEAFLDRSGYFAEGVDKAAIVRAAESRRPVVTRVVPIAADSTVDAGTTELRFEFSQPMAAPFNSFGLGAGGRAQYPVTGRVGFSPDGRAYTVRVALEPGRTYSFVLEGSEGGGFRSADGWYPVRPDTITFTARARPR